MTLLCQFQNSQEVRHKKLITWKKKSDIKIYSLKDDKTLESSLEEHVKTPKPNKHSGWIRL